MIRSLFVPERVGTRYIGSSVIASIYAASSSTWHACVVEATAYSRTIIGAHTLALEAGQTEEELITSFKKVVALLPKHDKVRLVLPATYAVTKILSFPFSARAKIEQTLALELEPHLPFPLEQAVVDFVALSNTQTAPYQVLAAAASKQLIELYESAATQAGVTLECIVIDLVALVQQRSALPSQEGEGAWGYLYVQEHEALFLRYDDKLITQAHAIRLPAQAESGAATIAHTIEFLAQSATHKQINQLIVIQDREHASAFADDLHQALQVPVRQSTSLAFLATTAATSKLSQPDQLPALPALLTALGVEEESFDLTIYQTGRPQEIGLFKRRLITALILLGIAIALLCSKTIIDLARLKHEAASDENQAVAALKNQLPALKKRSGLTTLAAVNSAAERHIAKEENVWLALSATDRASLLQRLITLSKTLNREELGLQLKKMNLSYETMILEGTVRDFQALRVLEEGLKKTALFTTVPSLQNTQFSITLTFHKKA
jgi:hypothetical protein